MEGVGEEILIVGFFLLAFVAVVAVAGVVAVIVLLVLEIEVAVEVLLVLLSLKLTLVMVKNIYFHLDDVKSTVLTVVDG